LPSKSYAFLDLIKSYYFSGTNNIFIFLCFFILLYFFKNKLLTFSIFIILIYISTTFQIFIISILFSLILFFDLRKFLKFLFLIIVFSFLFLPLINLETNSLFNLINNLDPNLYTRISRVHHSLSAVYNNLFFGLGYGSDSINDLYLISEITALWGEGKYSNYKLILIHNSIIYNFYATGLIGGFLFIYYLFIYIFPKKFENICYEKLNLCLFSIIFISLISNTALESPNYSIAIFWIIGFLAAMNKKFDYSEKK